MPPETSTTQFKVRISDALVERLNQMARDYNRKSGNQIAAEILEYYADFWEHAEQAKLAMLEQQRAGLTQNVSGYYNRGKSSRGEIEKVKKDAISRKKNR
jgi:predicted transcriptional regulator